MIVEVKIRAELKGPCTTTLWHDEVRLQRLGEDQVDIFLIISISATYNVSETTSFCERRRRWLLRIN